LIIVIYIIIFEDHLLIQKFIMLKLSWFQKSYGYILTYTRFI